MQVPTRCDIIAMTNSSRRPRVDGSVRSKFNLRDRLLEATRDTVALAEACLEELRRQEAMFYALYKPGDRVLVEYQLDRVTVKRVHT